MDKRDGERGSMEEKRQYGREEVFRKTQLGSCAI